MAQKTPTLLLLTESTELAQKLVRVLDEHGARAFWVTEQEAENLAQPWDVEASIWAVSPPGIN